MFLVSCFQEKQFQKLFSHRVEEGDGISGIFPPKQRGAKAARAKSSEALGRRKLAQGRRLQDAEPRNRWEKAWGWWVP